MRREVSTNDTRSATPAWSICLINAVFLGQNTSHLQQALVHLAPEFLKRHDGGSVREEDTTPASVAIRIQ